MQPGVSLSANRLFPIELVRVERSGPHEITVVVQPARAADNSRADLVRQTLAGTMCRMAFVWSANMSCLALAQVDGAESLVVSFYDPLPEMAGDDDQFVLHLTRRPDDVGLCFRPMTEEEYAELHAMREVVPEA